MSSREPVYWYGNIIDLSVESKLQQDPEKFKNQNLEIAGANLIGIRRQEERHQETLLDEIIGTFNTKLQKRSELNKPEQTDSEDSLSGGEAGHKRKPRQRRRNNKDNSEPSFRLFHGIVSNVWKDKIKELQKSYRPLEIPTFRVKWELKEAIKHRQPLYGKCDIHMLMRLAEAEALLVDNSNADEMLLSLFDKFHAEDVSQRRSPLSLPSIIMFTVNDHQTLEHAPLPPEHNASMFVFFFFIHSHLLPLCLQC